MLSRPGCPLRAWDASRRLWSGSALDPATSNYEEVVGRQGFEP
jgi:hypothetical protein